MPRPPEAPRIYHITHVDNLAGIVGDGMLWSDAVLLQRGVPSASIGMESIKGRRLNLPVKCHLPDRVGDYVPFYFCPRSIMLYVIHCANHPELKYRGGQGPIIHLELDLHETIQWADSVGRRWAFSLSNAALAYAEFRSRVGDLEEIDWAAVRATDFRSAEVKEGKQAEFLVHESVPWSVVTRIGVSTPEVQRQAQRAFADSPHRPPVQVVREWYF